MQVNEFITYLHIITDCSHIRRRLAIMLVKLKMAETTKEAVTWIEQGHIRVGTEVVTDPAYFVTRNMEDYVTWVDSSKIKRKIMKYHDKVNIFITINVTDYFF